MKDIFPSLDGFRPNPDWAKLQLFNHKGWKRMPFGAFAESINERVEPSEAAEEIYVGLEHLDSQNLHIQRWGKGSDVIGTKLRFRKGDIIFGRRRAYQCKLVMAGFEGICSAHAMVVRAKPGMVLPEFLPFLMMSDKFMSRAVEISVGDEVLQSEMKLCVALSIAKDAFFDEELKKGKTAKPEMFKTLGKALTGIVAGKSPKASSNPAASDGFGVLKVSAVGDGTFCEKENKALLVASDFVPALEVKAGMILVTRCNALLSGIGRACLVEESRPGLMLSDKTLQLVPNIEIIDRDFLLLGLRREPYRGFVERSANGTEAKNISQETLRAAPFWIPSRQQQHVIIARLNQFTAALKLNQQQQKHFSLSLSALINEVIQ